MSFSPNVEREILSAFLDGELSADERRWVHEHLQGCADCREAVDEFGQIHGLVGELPRLIAPVAFLNEVLQQPETDVRRAATKAFSGKRRVVAISLAAAAVAITLAGLVVPPEAEEPPVTVYIERHVGVHSNEESGAQVLTAVGGR
ncbi:MAG: zf-HC2 domain-containing protein [Actinomycetota bacterium]